MTAKLIKNEKDYQRALSRIEELMDAAPGTAEFDELELLAALVEMYEDTHYPMDFPDPIAAIKFRMEQLGLAKQDLIPFFGSRSKVSEVLNKKRLLTLSMMRALNKGLGIPAEVLLQESGKDFPLQLTDLDWRNFPIVEMVKRSWISSNLLIKGNEEEIMRQFISEAGGINAISGLFFRKNTSPRQNQKMDFYALAAWCIRAISLACKSPLINKYKNDSLDLNTLRNIAKLSYLDEGPLLAKEYLNKLGIHLIAVKHLPKTYLDGASILLEKGTPLIALTIRYDRIDNFWFCLFHELAHVIRHLSRDTRMIIIDDLDLRGHEPQDQDKIEEEADRIAQEALIPETDWEQFDYNEKKPEKSVREFAEKLKIHPAIVAGRLRFEKQNYRLLTQFVGRGEVRKHFALQ